MSTAPTNHTEAFLRLAADARSRIHEITVAHLAALPAEEQPLLIDVREEDEWQQGHIAGAVHLSRGVIELRIHQHAVPERPILCYCQGGNRGALVADSLQKLGYRNVASLQGGLNAWKAAGLPVVDTADHS